MEVQANSFSLRGESGFVKIFSDSTFLPGQGAYSPEAECDIIVESDGFRANRVVKLAMSAIDAFLRDLGEVVRRRSGVAAFLGGDGGLSLRFTMEGDETRVECEANDRSEGKDNSIHVRYPIEPSYFKDLELALEGRSSDS
jgi:hypothetical protein